ncbi:MAG: GHKL domain-containing protein [Defluviitaleaceae bacterium]|nr:GHKL domain-containing protein [Defluviitaleaceae bacterium]
MTGFFFLIFFLTDTLTAKYEAKLKSERQAQEKEYYFAQCQLMQESIEAMKLYRHDVKLHLSTLRGYAVGNKPEEAAAYLDGLLGDITKGDAYSSTGHTAIDSIINHKLRYAAAQNIKLEVDIFSPPVINADVADLVVILGNLLDNALDAVAKVENKTISLALKFTKSNLFIKVDNTFDGEVKYVNNIIATRKTDGDHGYGLKNIRKAVERYNGHLDIRPRDGVFSVSALLYLNDA